MKWACLTVSLYSLCQLELIVLLAVLASVLCYYSWNIKYDVWCEGSCCTAYVLVKAHFSFKSHDEGLKKANVVLSVTV